MLVASVLRVAAQPGMAAYPPQYGSDCAAEARAAAILLFVDSSSVLQMFALACFGLWLPEVGAACVVMQLLWHSLGSLVARAWGGGWGSYSGKSQQCDSVPLALCMHPATTHPVIGLHVVAGSAPATRPRPQGPVS